MRCQNVLDTEVKGSAMRYFLFPECRGNAGCVCGEFVRFRRRV